MKLKKLLWLLLPLGLLTAGIAYGINVTIPQSLQKGNIPVGNANGTYNSGFLVAGTNITISTSTTGQITINGSAGSSVSTSSVQSIMLPLIANGTVAGVNATSSATSFLVQGTAGLNPFAIASSTGTQLLTILQNGNVGIGTSTPSRPLDIYSNNANVAPGFKIQCDTGCNNSNPLKAFSIVVGSAASSTFSIKDDTANAQRLVIDTNGNVGIGTTSPAFPLEVVSAVGANISASEYSGDTTAAGFLGRKARGTLASPSQVLSGDNLSSLLGRGYTSDAGWGTANVAAIIFQAAENFTSTNQGTIMTFGTTPLGSTTRTERMRIDNAGNVGIGTSTPSAHLHVYGNDTVSAAFVNTAALGSSSGAGIVGYAFNTPTAADQRLGYFLLGSKGGADQLYHQAGMAAFSAGAWTAGVSHPTYLSLYTTATGTPTRSEVVRIDSSGNVGIGTTTPNATLHVYGSNAFKYNALAASVTSYTVATSTDNIIYISTTTAASTINLPACGGTTDQVIYTVKDKGGAAGTQNITVTATAGNTIDGASTKVLNTNYSSTKVQCVSGSGWFILP